MPTLKEKRLQAQLLKANEKIIELEHQLKHREKFVLYVKSIRGEIDRRWWAKNSPEFTLIDAVVSFITTGRTWSLESCINRYLRNTIQETKKQEIEDARETATQNEITGSYHPYGINSILPDRCDEFDIRILENIAVKVGAEVAFPKKEDTLVSWALSKLERKCIKDAPIEGVINAANQIIAQIGKGPTYKKTMAEILSTHREQKDPNSIDD